jgi:hypothetical protein
MNKSETREVSNLATFHKLGMSDVVARGMSALIRAARTSKSRAALMEYADLFSVTAHPDFII